MRNRLKICPNDRRMEGIADIYVIYFQASLFPLTFAPAPQQGQLTVSTSYMNVTLRHKSVDNIRQSAPRLDFRRLQGAVSDPLRRELFRGMSAGSFSRTAAGNRA